jgi:hypothetical protein
VSKESWPEFPLWWLEESRRNMGSLNDIVSHLHEKTATYGNHASGVRGDTNEVEKQIVEHISVLRQQVGVLTDVVQASLQIIAEDHERRSTRTRRMFASIREAWKRFWLAIEQNIAYKIVAIIGTIVGAASIFWGVIRHFHLFGR